MPFIEHSTIGEYIDKFFLEYENKDEFNDEDQNMFYDNNEATKKVKFTTVKNNKNDGYYQETDNKRDKNKVFELEVFWNKNKIQANLNKLSRCKRHQKFEEICEKAYRATSEKITLRNCFDNFMETKILGQDDAWYCCICKKHVEARKKIELYSASPILLINLERSISSKESYFKNKIEDKVVFPVDELDLSDIIISNKDAEGNKKNEILYELYAVSNYYGNMDFGHYTAYGKNPVDETWYHFDDSHVSQVYESKNIVTEAG